MNILEQEPSQFIKDDSTKFWLMGQIREKLREKRKEEKISQTELAKKIGKDQVFVSNVESGRRRMDPIELLAFSSALNISIQDIIDNLDINEARSRDYYPGA